MNILVTGGTGFTGSALSFRLLKLHHKVTILDNQAGLFAKELMKKGAKVVIGSVTDKKLVDKVAKKVDVIFHLAAAFRKLNVPEQLYKEVNVDGTKNVMEAALKNKVEKVIYCSTQGVHGHVENPPGDESSPIEPADYYQQTKYDGEVVVREYTKKNVGALILRPTAIYGPGDPERFFMIFKRVKKGMFPLFGSGKTYYHPLYIDNLVDAFILAMKSKKKSGEAYLIADEEYYTIEELVHHVGEAMHVPVKTPHFPLFPLIIAGHVCEKFCKPFKIKPFIFPRRVDWYRQVRAFKIDKARKELKYHPKIGIQEGLRRTYEWYKERGYL